MSLDLYALIFHLHPLNTATLPAMVGKEAHAAFLSLVREVDADLATWLHADQQQVKPFGVSLLAPHAVLQARQWQVQAGSTLRLRITVAGRELYEALMRRFLEGQYTLRLGRAQFQTGRIIANDPGEPLAGYSTMAELWESATPAARQTVRFIMPTTWKEGPSGHDFFTLLPTPAGFYKTLSKTWDAYAKQSDPDLRFDPAPLLRGLEQADVIVSAHHLQTVHWESTKPPTAGMIGKATYHVAGDAAFQRTIDLLTRFSFFAGVGNSRGRGLGVVAPLAPRTEVTYG